jgi:hypothetical protein
MIALKIIAIDELTNTSLQVTLVGNSALVTPGFSSNDASVRSYLVSLDGKTVLGYGSCPSHPDNSLTQQRPTKARYY